MGRRILVVVAVLLLGLGILPHRASNAQTVPDPTFFALTQSELPDGAQIVDSRVANNGAISSANLQPGQPPAEGRITGYYLQARTFTPSGGLASVITTLISIFGTNRQAQDAFANQQTFWQNEVTNYPNSAYEEDLGDFFLAHLYTLRDANGNMSSELFFQRGQIFFEVALQDFASRSREERSALLIQLARTLESRANGTPPPLTPTATDTPTATPTSTATPRPTATPRVKATVKPRATATRTPRPTATPHRTATSKPTATPSYGRPIPERPHCKQGYKLVKGKCKKT